MGLQLLMVQELALILPHAGQPFYILGQKGT